MNQRGYILPCCLLFLALICTLSLSILTHNYWQQKLTTMVITHKQKELDVYHAVNQFFEQNKDFTHNACTLDWQQFDTVWQKLIADEACCTVKQSAVMLRYMVISHEADEPVQVAIIARFDATSAWQQFIFSESKRLNTP